MQESATIDRRLNVAWMAGFETADHRLKGMVLIMYSNVIVAHMGK
jgi:hypothetical protein